MGSSLSNDERRYNGTNFASATTTVPSEQVNQNVNTGQQHGLSDNTTTPETDQTGVIGLETNNPMNTTNTNGTFPNANQNIDQDFSINLFGYVLYPWRSITLTTLSSWLGPMSSLAMIVGCVIPYVPQYLTIYRSRSCAGFSTFVCLTLLLANILRIAFWFGHRFELPLLIQSIIMILAQILLLELCVRVKRNNSIVRRTLFKSNPKWFWRWTDLASYLEFLIIVTVLLGFAVYFLLEFKPFIETLGCCGLVIESMLGLPQVLKNYQNRSVQGMSLSMVLMWLAGDTFKTAYFIANAVPYQFWLCGLLQISIDLVILGQDCFYRRRAPMKKGADQSRTSSLEHPDSPKETISL